MDLYAFIQILIYLKNRVIFNWFADCVLVVAFLVVFLVVFLCVPRVLLVCVLVVAFFAGFGFGGLPALPNDGGFSLLISCGVILSAHLVISAPLLIRIFAGVLANLI